MNFKAVLIFAALAAVALPFAAHAQSASTTFDVTITIDSTCSIDTPAATDVDFGALTRALVETVTKNGAKLHLNQRVRKLKREKARA